MPNKPLPPDSGTYSRNGNGSSVNNGAAPPENRFAEVQRKSRAARQRLVDATKVRAAEDDRRADAARSEHAERDRQIDRDNGYDRATRDTFNTAREHATPRPEPAPQSALEKAAAQLDAAADPANEADAE